MKKNNIIKHIKMIFIIILVIFFILTPKTYASDPLMEIFDKADDFINSGNSSTPTLGEESIQDMSNLIYNVLLVIAIVILIIWGMAIGIQYMTGSVGERVRIKESLIPYIVGCVVIFGSFTIWEIIVNLLQATA